MSFKTQGRVILIGQPTRGTSQAGKEWSKRSFVIDDEAAQYPKKISFDTMNKPELFNDFKEGDKVEVDFNVESREYQSKYYTNCNAFKVSVLEKAKGGQPEEIRKPYSEDENSDLPF